jgi:hypothetical protein
MYEKAKREIEGMEEMNSELQIKKRQLIDLDASLKLQEEKSGFAGFRDVIDRLEQTSKDTVTLNELKSQTLEEISVTIQKIALLLEGKRKELEPKVVHAVSALHLQLTLTSYLLAGQ